MIQFSSGPAVVRRGEFAPFPGVRSRIRAIPYAGLELPGVDPWKGEYRRKIGGMEVAAGPIGEGRWEEAFAGAPAGSILVGPIAECEPVYGTARAVLGAVSAAGRGAVIVDSLCDGRVLPGGEEFVWIAVWRGGGDEEFWKRAREARENGRAGVALPLIPGWTTEPEFLRNFLDRAMSAGIEFAAPFEISLDGVSRSAIHADFSERFPERADSYFDDLHHRDWSDVIARVRSSFAEQARAAGISARAPLPRGRREFEANLRAQEALDAEADRIGEPSASILWSASRRIEDFGRDLAELAKRGNGRLLFSPDSREWRLIEEAIGVASASPRP
jgi:hypothetical protein